MKIRTILNHQEEKEIYECNNLCIEIWNTAILLPFQQKADMFYLMDDFFTQNSNNNILFHKLRNEIEKSNSKLSIHEIYQNMNTIFGVEKELCNKLEILEKSLFKRFSSTRNYIKELYDSICSNGGKVSFYNNSNLEEKFVEIILKLNGYSEIEYIYNQKKEVDIEVLRLERPIDIFDNHTSKRVDCNVVTKRAVGNTIDYEQVKNSPGFGAMQSICANFYFDNPLREWKKGSLINADAYFAGYYLLGMHIAGILKWIHRNTKRKKYNRILFAARDGYMIMRGYQLYRTIFPELPSYKYIQASRKSLMPSMLRTESDFYQLPGSFHEYSPYTTILLLWVYTNCTNELDFRHKSYKKFAKQIQKTVEDEGFDYYRFFESYAEQCAFISFFLKTYYERKKHEKLFRIAKKYFSDFSEDDLLFDLGYSGRLQKEIMHLCDCTLDNLYLFSDEEHLEFMERHASFHTSCYYNITPSCDNMIREYLISENAPSCIGFDWNNGKVEPIMECEKEEYPYGKTIETIQKGALDFIDQLLEIFGSDIEMLPFKAQEVSLPFEGFIREILEEDLSMFSNVFQEDFATGERMNDSWDIVYKNFMSHLPKVKDIYSRKTKLQDKFIECFMESRPIAYFGTGKICKNILESFPEIEPVLLLDNAEKEKNQLYGIPVINPSNVECLKKYCIIITTKYYEDIKEQLIKLGLQENVNFIWYKQLIKDFI